MPVRTRSDGRGRCPDLLQRRLCCEAAQYNEQGARQVRIGDDALRVGYIDVVADVDVVVADGRHELDREAPGRLRTEYGRVELGGALARS